MSTILWSNQQPVSFTSYVIFSQVPEPAAEGKDGKSAVKTKEERIEALAEEIRHNEVLRAKAEGRIEALKLAGSKFSNKSNYVHNIYDIHDVGQRREADI